MRERITVIGLVVLLLLGCGKKGPQRPSQRMGQAPEADSTHLALLELNMQLASVADKQIMSAVSAQKEHYALYEGNVWMYILETGDTEREKPVEGECCTLHMRVYTLDGHLLEDSEGSYMLGKSELPYGIDRNVRELNHGAEARMYVPWYTAFGQQGTDHVLPYENVIIDIEVQ